jgi:hypothetical protein
LNSVLLHFHLDLGETNLQNLLKFFQTTSSAAADFTTDGAGSSLPFHSRLFVDACFPPHKTNVRTEEHAYEPRGEERAKERAAALAKKKSTEERLLGDVNSELTDARGRNRRDDWEEVAHTVVGDPRPKARSANHLNPRSGKLKDGSIEGCRWCEALLLCVTFICVLCTLCERDSHAYYAPLQLYRRRRHLLPSTDVQQQGIAFERHVQGTYCACDSSNASLVLSCYCT